MARTRNEIQQLCRVNRPGNKNKENGIGTGLAGKASRTALKTGSLFLAACARTTRIFNPTVKEGAEQCRQR